MSDPGDQDARTPDSWQRGRPGYRATAPPHRDLVRGFPPRRTLATQSTCPATFKIGTARTRARTPGGSRSGPVGPQPQRLRPHVSARRVERGHGGVAGITYY